MNARRHPRISSLPVPRERSLTYHPGLDGLRGLAVAAVLLFHQNPNWTKGAFLGVSTFFTLSGFLITTLLLAERTFRRLDTPELLAEVAEGVLYVDGVREKRGTKRAAA